MLLNADRLKKLLIGPRIEVLFGEVMLLMRRSTGTLLSVNVNVSPL